MDRHEKEWNNSAKIWVVKTAAVQKTHQNSINFSPFDACRRWSWRHISSHYHKKKSPLQCEAAAVWIFYFTWLTRTLNVRFRQARLFAPQAQTHKSSSESSKEKLFSSRALVSFLSCLQRRRMKEARLKIHIIKCREKGSERWYKTLTSYAIASLLLLWWCVSSNNSWFVLSNIRFIRRLPPFILSRSFLSPTWSHKHTPPECNFIINNKKVW